MIDSIQDFIQETGMGDADADAGDSEFSQLVVIRMENGGRGRRRVAKLSAPSEKSRYLRRRVARAEREFVWRSTGGICYLCKTELPVSSSWHIEHVVAFSDDPKLVRDLLYAFSFVAWIY